MFDSVEIRKTYLEGVIRDQYLNLQALEDVKEMVSSLVGKANFTLLEQQQKCLHNHIKQVETEPTLYICMDCGEIEEYKTLRKKRISPDGYKYNHSRVQSDGIKWE